MGIFPKTGRCDFGSMGICCRQCLMGPCRIWHKDVGLPLRVNTPNQTRGTCGATADTIVARNWLVFHARGCAAHSTTCKEVAETLLKTARRETTYELKDKVKLKAVAGKLGFSNGASDAELADADHQPVIGMMADPYYFIMQSLKVGVADIMALTMTTEIHDILLGTPSPVPTKIGISVVDEKQVNIAMHGHIPTLREKLIEHSQTKEFKDKVALVGAEGINIVGLCCTGAEVLQRHRIPLAGNNLQEDLLIATGVVDAFIMDVQCSYPSTHSMAENFHTKIITTMKDARVPMADHIPFEPEKAGEWAKQA